jgi:hypothetical protein
MIAHGPHKRLRPGDLVEVKTEAEILATLGPDGTLEALPFTPEMRKFCGRQLRVKSWANRTVAERLSVRRMENAVHLENVRCDGEAHDGCARGCLLFWKESWLDRVGERRENRPVPAAPPEVSLRTREGDRYLCQATELARATRHLPAHEMRQYLDALIGEDVKAIDLFKSMAIFAYDVVVQRLFRGREWNHIQGPCEKTPSVTLGLQPGDRVRVKSKEEIVATLDANGWNRKMEFSREMVPHCGRDYKVLRRVDRMIRDHNGQMVTLKDTVILEGLVYKDLVRLACPRSEYMFWRECWLERV